MTRRNIRRMLMTDIDIHHTHALGRQACRSAIDELAQELSARFGLGPMTWVGDTASFTGRGIEGQLVVGDSTAHARVRLGALPSLMRPLIDVEIRRRLRERLG